MSSFLYGALGIMLFATISPPMQILARRMMPSVSPVLILAAGLGVSHITTTLLGLRLTESFQYWTAASVLFFGAMVYIQVFGAVLKSISLRILLDLVGRPHRAIELEEISRRQVPLIFSERCELLIAGGMVACEHNKFVPTAAGRKLAARVTLIRRWFAIGDSGLYNFSSASPESVSKTDRAEI
jgi:hypothetical protein